MRSSSFLCTLALCLAVAACRSVPEPGGLLEALPNGTLQQSTFGDSPIQVSTDRLEQLQRRHAGLPQRTTPTAPPAVSLSTEPENSSAEIDAGLVETTAEDLGDEEAVASDSVAELPLKLPAGDGPPPTENNVPSTSGTTDNEPVSTTVPSPKPVEGSVEPQDEASKNRIKEPEELADSTAATQPDSDDTPKTLTQVLVPSPATDADALAAIDALPRAEASPASTSHFPDGASSSSSGCESDTPLLRTATSQMRMGRWWVEDGKQFAELSMPDGSLHLVAVGDRVGPEGGKVVRIDRTEVIVGEIGFDLAGAPTLQAKPIKAARP